MLAGGFLHMVTRLDTIIQNKIESIRNQCEFDFIKLAFFQRYEMDINTKSVYASGNRSMRYMRIVLQTRIGLAGQVLKTGRPAFVINVDEEIKQSDFHKYPIIMAEGLKSLGALPLFKEEQVIGVLLAGFRTKNKMTYEIIERFKSEVKSEFGSLENKELKKS